MGPRPGTAAAAAGRPSTWPSSCPPSPWPGPPTRILPNRPKAAGWQGTRLACCARWLGLDRNPLRRRTDRIETAIRLVVMILLITALPVAAIAAGQGADHLALRQARPVSGRSPGKHRPAAAGSRDRHPGPVLEGPDRLGAGPLTASRLAGPVRPGPGPGGDAREAPCRPGSTAPARSPIPPADPRDAVADVCIAVVLTCLASFLVLLGRARLWPGGRLTAGG